MGDSFRVALVAMPWPLFNRPPIQLGILKAYLAQEWPQGRVDCLHPFLAVAAHLGTGLYHEISQSLWLAEALYAALLDPDQAPAALAVAGRAWRRLRHRGQETPATVSRGLAAHLGTWLGEVDWTSYRLVGFSICYGQLAASLAAIRGIKDRAPAVRIVAGGASCAGELGAALAAACPEIDFVVPGEGEAALLGLCRFLAGEVAELPAGVLATGPGSGPGAPARAVDLARLPAPDYRDYFTALGELFGPAAFFPDLPVELSRGCPWRRCAFCSLNLQWQGYRPKKASQVAAEVAVLASRHRLLDLAFMDNALPPGPAAELFATMAAQKRDYRAFAELRAGASTAELARMRAGGLREIQVGIEALAAGLLARMAKGTTVMDNVSSMRAALAAGIRLSGNLMIGFPGSTEVDVQETLTVLDLVFPCSPLDLAFFFLGHGSPVDQDPARFGIRAVFPHPTWRRLFGPGLGRALAFPVKGYAGDRGAQARLWAPVVRRVREWQRYHRRRGATAVERPLLSFREGGDFLLLRQETAAGQVLRHRLAGTSRAIYLACQEPVALSELQVAFPQVRPPALEGFLAELVAKRLLFQSAGRCLALAVPEAAPGGQP
ncbi:MAG: RiPP maturation radical SAM C-methyltransferase [Thermodesulfobacteriota bacterium]